MDLNGTRSSETFHSSLAKNSSGNHNPNRPFSHVDWSNLQFNAGTEQPFHDFSAPLYPSSLHSHLPNHDVKKADESDTIPVVTNTLSDWDPRTMLSNLSFLEQKIHQVQDVVRTIISREGHIPLRPNDLAVQQQLMTADLTSIIIQLISTAGSLLPSIKSTLLSVNPSIRQLKSMISTPAYLKLDTILQQHEGFPLEGSKVSNCDGPIKEMANCVGEGSGPPPAEDHEVKDSEDTGEGENLPLGSYEVLQLEKEEILAPHSHFCQICGKGFKRDANLRMHMRGHGDEYKNPAALAKPSKESNSDPVLVKRYSCPFLGCKRNKDHKKFQPLKTFLCVKNHYKRSHCDKSYTCNRCNSKKFSVIADLKTHEKHCGRDKWLCSCGTTFSRKDKLFGHVALFTGHTPALPLDETKESVNLEEAHGNQAVASWGCMGFNFEASSSDDAHVLDVKGMGDDPTYYSTMNFDPCSFSSLNEFQ